MYDAIVKEQNTINGVNVDELMETINAVKEQPELGKFRFRGANSWIGGANNRTSINEFFGAGEEQTRAKTFVIEKDEPLALLGTDKGVNPVECALAALAGCLTTTLVYFAAAQKVALRKVTSKVEGEGDLRGFLGLDENIRMGCDNIRIAFEIEADAPKEKIEALVELAKSRSGVFDMLTNKVPVSVELTSKAKIENGK